MQRLETRPAGPLSPPQQDQIAELAHDLRNMLACALLHFEALEATLAGAPRTRLARGLAAIDRARLMLEQTVDAADRDATLRLQHFDIHALAVEIASEMSVREQIPIEVRAEPDLAAGVLSCPSRVTRILQNLVFNALGALKGRKGHVTITLRRQPGGLVNLSVADSGPGFPAEIGLAPGGRRLPSARGGGLGLAASSRMAELLGGRLFIASSGPDGTRIDVMIRDFSPGFAG